ncbi:AlpA family phage regulatory protein [Psychrobacter sp. SWN149]|nr:AlpA family phage regulatory protein [Psychrobacter sp. SWN149]
MLDIKGISYHTHLSRCAIYKIINGNSDRSVPVFPKKVQFTKVRVVWSAL